ncbi:MAG: DNA-formamidopyrimidine glycosylase [Anaerolineae bacterium]|nr:DNA-formamidopyrimidine glycosylase [Anaerolineae bacterium]
MPELPDLEIIREVLAPRITGQTITDVEVVRPLVVRDLTGRGFAEALTGQTFADAQRRGKVLLFPLQSKLTLAINCKLAGRLQCAAPSDRRQSKTHVVLHLSDGHELRYSDQRTMGQIYLTADLAAIPGWTEMGPEPFGLTLEEFRRRLQPHQGEIKSALTHGFVVAGIGNAYADEICFAARIHPYRKSTALDGQEIERLYEATQSVLREAIATLRERVGTEIHREVRDFLAVHGKGGQPCPACSTIISEIKAQGRPTNFCRTCQPGGLMQF